MDCMIARPAAAGLWLLLLTTLTASTAIAEVTLATEVSKVVSTLDGSGRVERQLVPVEEVVPGEELRYTITFSNESDMPVEPERIVVINPIPDGTVYVPGSAGGTGSVVEYSQDGETWSRVAPADGAAGGAGSPGTARAGQPGTGAAPGGAGEGAGGFAAEPSGAAAGDPATSGAGSSAGTSGTSKVHSLRWTYQEELPPGDSEVVFFHVRMQ
jgi:uncharacterized repeat protein (TIGR01451 family)